MATVTEHFGIDGSVPFVNVHVERDNLMFVDPSAIRNDRTPRGRAANTRLTTLFKRVVEAARSNSPSEHAIGLELLQHLHEPNETRLGMSKGRPSGRAFAEVLAGQFWEELRRNELLQRASIERLEYTRVFLNMVGDDRISDMTTRIVFDVLANFTAQMMETFPNLQAGATTAKTDVWIPANLRWEERSFHLPFAEGKQLLLVPLSWVYWRSLMYPDQYYNLYATEAILVEESTYDEKGRRHGPSKESVKLNNPGIKFVNTKKTTEYIVEHDRSLINEYRDQIDREFEPLSSDEIDRRIGE